MSTYVRGGNVDTWTQTASIHISLHLRNVCISLGLNQTQQQGRGRTFCVSIQYISQYIRIQTTFLYRLFSSSAHLLVHVAQLYNFHEKGHYTEYGLFSLFYYFFFLYDLDTCASVPFVMFSFIAWCTLIRLSTTIWFCWTWKQQSLGQFCLWGCTSGHVWWGSRTTGTSTNAPIQILFRSTI